MFGLPGAGRIKLSQVHQRKEKLRAGPKKVMNEGLCSLLEPPAACCPLAAGCFRLKVFRVCVFYADPLAFSQLTNKTVRIYGFPTPRWSSPGRLSNGAHG